MADPAPRVAFFGTPAIAVPSLLALHDAADLDVVVAVTNPDRARGRSGTPRPPPVKDAAVALGIEVLQPTRPAEALDALRERAIDVAAVVAYGALLPREVLEVAAHGFVNLHFSLLPRWRGAAPVQHAIRAGDRTTGVTTFVLDEGMDTGPILAQEVVQVDPDETAGELLERLASLGAPILVDSIRDLLAGSGPRSQPVEGVSLAPKIAPEDVRIEWTRPADEVVDLVRSANPAPGAHTGFRGERLKVWRTRREDGDGVAGTVLRSSPDGPIVACGDGAVVLLEVQPAGKGRSSGRDFVNGYQPRPGERLASEDR